MAELLGCRIVDQIVRKYNQETLYASCFLAFEWHSNVAYILPVNHASLLYT
jgi:hypothetical protein